MVPANLLFFLFLISPQLCSMALVGDKTPMTTEMQRNDLEFNAGLKKAVIILNQISENMYKYDIVKVTSATKQIVQGERYEASIELAATVCLNNEVRI